MTQHYPAFPLLTVVEQARAARELATQPPVSSPSPSDVSELHAIRAGVFARLAATVYGLLVALVGPESRKRRADGCYQVLAHLERESLTLEALADHPPVQAPRLATLDVVAPASPSSHLHAVLLETERPGLTFTIEALPAPLVCARRYNPAWPQPLRNAYRACLAAHTAWSCACEADWSEAHARRGMAQRAYESWRDLETCYQPCFLAWEAAAK